MPYTVRIVDQARHADPEGEYEIAGFATPEQAEEFCRRFLRDSLEELRKDPPQTTDELRRLWHLFGEDAQVIETGYRASDELDGFLATPAASAERDWPALRPLRPT